MDERNVTTPPDPFPGYEAFAVEIDGVVTKYPLITPGRKSKFKFAWGRPGHRSGVWNVIAERKGDVYVSEETLGTDMKVSLHKERWWNVGWIKDNDGNLTDLGQQWMDAHNTRHLHQRPRPEVEGPILLGIRIFVTWHDVQDWPDDEETEDSLTWLEPPDEGEVSFIVILFTKPYIKPIKMNVQVLHVYGMRNGEAVLVTLGYQKLPKAEVRVMNDMRED